MEKGHEVGAETDLGHPGLDAEHRGQLELMNRLEEAIASGMGCEEIVVDLERLVSYLEAHFLSEQAVMREHAYPEYEAHLREHERAISLLHEMRARCVAGDARMTTTIVGALRGWFLAHIETTDRKLATFLMKRGIPLH